MKDLKILEGKKLLIVDDEPDILKTLMELLDMCLIDTARTFENAEELIDKNPYDLAIFDIMGVRGYDLLEIAVQKKIPAVMFTAHALSSNDFAKSIEYGAKMYLPKEEMTDIASYLADFLKDQYEGKSHSNWFSRLKSFFERQFGIEWVKDHQEIVNKYDWLYPDD